MVFDIYRRHFFRYQLSENSSSNTSTPSRMLARSTIISKSPPAKQGDVIWLLSRLGTKSPAKYRFIYAFVVDTPPIIDKEEYRFEGQTGLWLSDSVVVSDLPWFAAFFKGMGNGGISIKEIKPDVVEELRKLFDKGKSKAEVNLENLTEKAANNRWPEDTIRYGAIKARRGQAEFRARLLTAYGRRCCISGCRVEALLEAAHIKPHAAEPNYNTRNGLLLRADLHTLYDLHLLGVDENGAVILSSEVTDLYYKNLIDGVRRIMPPDRGEDRPSEDDRRIRMALFRH